MGQALKFGADSLPELVLDAQRKEPEDDTMVDEMSRGKHGGNPVGLPRTSSSDRRRKSQ